MSAQWYRKIGIALVLVGTWITVYMSSPLLYFFHRNRYTEAHAAAVAFGVMFIVWGIFVYKGGSTNPPSN